MRKHSIWLFASSFLLFLFLSVFSTSASVLVIAPHPDDDVIMASGVIYRALQNGEPVRVVFMTNGDFSGLEAGSRRLREAVDAQSQLGMVENDLIFLGYPDGALNTIFSGYPLSSDTYVSVHGQSETYGNRGLGRSDYHTHRYSSPAQYNGANITLDLKTILTDFSPDHIFTTSEYDATTDHTATYQFLKTALEQLSVEDPSYNPTIHKTIVWASNSSIWPNEYDPTAYFSDAINLSGNPLLWNERESLDVPVIMQSTFYAGNPKYMAIESHSSQYSTSSFLGRWIHKDEIFWVEQANDTNQPPIVSAGFDQSVDEGTTVQLDGSGSTDRDGDILSFEWRQVEGTPVLLSDIHSATPTFETPANITQDELLSFELIVSDGQFSSYADAVNVLARPTLATQPVYTNVIPSVTALTASSVYSTSDVSNVIDGCIDGYPQNAACEWASNRETEGAWVELSWGSPLNIGRVVLYDRVNLSDQISQGVITFSDGTSIYTGLLDNSGRGGEYSFTPRKVTSLRYTVIKVSSNTTNVGLSEIEVFAIDREPIAQVGGDQTVAASGLVQLSGSQSYDPDGNSITYLWTQIDGPAVVLSDPTAVDPTFIAPTGLATNAVLIFELVVNDAVLDSLATQVAINVLPVQEEVNHAPIAHAGTDQTVQQGSQVTLDGSDSSDPDGDVIGYSWFQSSGESVALSDAFTDRPTFTAPTGLSSEVILTFEMRVNDGELESAPSKVNITVQKKDSTDGSESLPTVSSGGSGASGCFISSL